MKVRSVTCFFDPRSSQAYRHLDTLSTLARDAVTLFGSAGMEAQTPRLATVPFPLLYQTEDLPAAVQLAQTLESDAAERGFTYLSLGPALPAYPTSFDLVAPILAATKNVFLTGLIATPAEGLSLPAARACARIITQATTLEPEGFANLRFAALANLSPHGPFFPGSFHAGERPGFSLAVECADVVLDVFRKAVSLADGRQRLITALEDHASALTTRAVHLAQQYNLDFYGIDFSPAPYPQDWCSLGAAIEQLGPAALGLSGSLAAAAFVADSLDRGRWLKVGFNGLMLPVLEDSRLAKRAAEGSLTLKDLLLYSAVCGCGLDTVPLPGDASAEQITGVLLDVGALALRLNKPLVARLMPIPGKAAGDPTGFDFEFFANSRVLALDAAPLQRGFANSEESLSIKPRG